MDSNIDSEIRSQEEYETQFFSFGRQVLKNSLKNLVESKIQSLIQDAEKYFTSSPDLSKKYKENVISKCLYLLDFCMGKSKIQLAEINSFFDQHFSIPKNVYLPEDENHQNISQEEVDQLKHETEEIRSRILSLDAAEAVFEKELAEAEDLQYLFKEDKAVRFILEAMKQTNSSIHFPNDLNFDNDISNIIKTDFKRKQ